MKKVFVCLIGMCILCTACVPSRLVVVNSEGIASYNPRTGQIEIMWSHSEKPIENPVLKDSLEDSIKIAK